MQLVTRTTYNNAGYLLSRKRNNSAEETFGYDSLDRLVSVSSGGEEAMSIVYAPNGNIISKTGIGNYEYDSTCRPHAVTAVDNTGGRISGRTLDTAYNGIGRIRRIDMGRMPGLVPGGDISKDSLGHGIEPIRPLMSGIPGGISLPGGGMDAAWEVVTLPYTMDIGYGPDGERWHSSLTNNGREILGTVYAGDYEKVTDHGVTREFYYLDANTIVIKRDGEFKQYVAFTDNLGSILAVVDSDGSKVFEASYDAWGRQTVALNTIGLQRGYCGHEMLSRFGLINMNGRLYDPDLGRFLSPDNYVQMPDNSQNFNRYSYCLNNPLKYTDPSGGIFGIDDAVFAFAAFNMAGSMMRAAFDGKSVLKAGVLSFLSSAASYGVGEMFKGATMTFGNELLRAGAHGLASGVISALDGGKLLSSFVSGATSSGIGSFAQSVHMDKGLMLASTTAMGGFVAWATGGDILQGAMQGLIIGALNHAQHDPVSDGPTAEIERRKMMSRLRMKYDPKYRQREIREIEKDGILTFEEALYWYGYGDGSTICVDASKLDLGRIDVTGRKVGEQWSLSTLSFSGNHKVGLVYGNIKVEYKGNNMFYIKPDTYDFDIHTDNFFKWNTILRNIETIGASILHGSGIPFKIKFKGLYHNK